jgi:uncharacterized membrane protein
MTEKIKSPDRLVFFSDAVVAIALTLLILPLADAVRQTNPLTGAPLYANSLELIEKNQSLIWAFLLSFVVIVRFWMSHHKLYQQVKEYSAPLMMTNLLWVLTIAILPFPTELVATYPSHDRLTLVFYVGMLFVNSLLLSVMLVIIRDSPDVLREPGAISSRWQFDAVTSTATMGISLVLVAVFPALTYYPLLLNVLQPWVVRLRFRHQ